MPGTVSLSAYELAHLVEDLESAGMEEQVHALLARQTPPDGSPPRSLWYELRQSGMDLRGYLDDVERAWRMAREPAGAILPLRCFAR